MNTSSIMPGGFIWMLPTFLCFIFFLFTAVFTFVFYATKKQLNQRIRLLQNENDALLAKLTDISAQVNPGF